MEWKGYSLLSTAGGYIKEVMAFAEFPVAMTHASFQIVEKVVYCRPAHLLGEFSVVDCSLLKF